MTEGTRLLAGRYQLGDLIGRGGMSDVHIGTDSRLGRRVAIKLLKPALAMDPKFRVLFREEAQKAARMAHPTIVRVFDAGEETVREPNGVETQVPYIVMEYVDGRLLRDIIADGPLEPREAVRIVSGILTALEYSHRALLVHRDIKPGNVMVTQTGQVKVMDFGIARAVSDNSATVADTSTVLGTAQYFSPEQARGETVDARTDLYSTGVVLFELLTGKPPFRGDRAAAVAYQHISETPVAPSTLNSRVSPALDAVVLHSLAKDKFERFQTAAEFRDDLETAAAGEVPVHKAPVSDFNATLFGVNPSSTAGSEAAMRQLSTHDDDHALRTQTRPPVAWIWAGIAMVIVILIAVVIWVVTLPTGNDLSGGLSVKVPSVTGQTYDAGAKKLTALKLVPARVQELNKTVPAGAIIRTSPSAGVKVGAGQSIQVYVSLGKSRVTVPAMTNLTEDAGKEALKSLGLKAGAVTTEHSPNVAAGIVIRSSPESNTALDEGDVVDLVVSDGLITVPDVTGKAITDAAKEMRALQLSVIAQQDDSCSGLKVSAQSLPPGGQPQRSAVTLTYCSGS